MQHCDNANDAWDMLNGVCICVEQPCEEADFYFDFNDCNCKCLDMKECADQEGYGENKLMLWDKQDCRCICMPESCDGNYAWNVDECQCECAIQTCKKGEAFDYESCTCKCEPVKCEPGYDFFNENGVCDAIVLKKLANTAFTLTPTTVNASVSHTNV